MNKSTNSETLINQKQQEKKNEIEDENKNETKIVSQDDIKSDIKEDSKTNIKENIKSNTKNETQIDTKEEIKENTKEDGKENMKKDTKEEIKMDEIKDDKLIDEKKDEIKMEEIKENIKNDLKEETKDKLKEDIKDEIKNQPNYWRSEKGYKRKYQFREKRNYQVAEICVLLMLLNEHFQIELAQSSKRKTKVTNQIFYLRKMIQGKEIIDVEEIIRRRCKEKLEFDVNKGTDTHKAKRRLETYKINEMIHFMIDILSFYGYNFQSHYSTGVDGQLKNETIKRIWKKDFVMYNQFDIENIGMKIHDFMKKQIDNNDCVFKPNEIKKCEK